MDFYYGLWKFLFFLQILENIFFFSLLGIVILIIFIPLLRIVIPVNALMKFCIFYILIHAFVLLLPFTNSFNEYDTSIIYDNDL